LPPTTRREEGHAGSVAPRRDGRTELEVLLECVREGIARAKTNREISQKTGRLKYAGRKPSIDVDQVKALHASGIGPAAIAKQLKVARSSPKF